MKNLWRYINFYIFKRRNFYVIRKSFKDKSTQIGKVYIDIFDAIHNCIGEYKVYNAKGHCIYNTIDGYKIQSEPHKCTPFGFFDNLNQAISYCPKGFKVYKVETNELVYDPEQLEGVLISLFNKNNDTEKSDQDIQKDIFDEIYNKINII